MKTKHSKIKTNLRLAVLVILGFSFIYPNAVSALNFDDSMGGKIGPLTVNMDFCEQTDKIAGIANSFSNARWSIASGAPGVITGVLSKDSVVLEFCDFLSRVKSLSYQDALLATAEGGNKILGLGFDDQIALTRSTLDLKDVFLEPSGKAKDFSKLATASNAKKLDNYFKEVGDYSDKNHGTNFNVRDRSQIESDMARLNQLSYKRTVLNEQTNCPKPSSDSNISEIYEKEIVPLEEEKETLVEYVNFYSESLRKMGIKFSGKNDYEKYLKDLSELERFGNRYEITVRNHKVETTKKREVKSVNKEDRLAPKTEEYKAKVTKNYQTFAVIPDPEKLDKFIKKYKGPWAGYTYNQVVQNSNSLFNKPTKLVDDEFKDFSIMCNRAELGKQFDKNDPKYYDLLEEEYLKCVASTNKKIEETGGLLVFYANELFNKHKKLKETNAYIWTFESFHLGNFRTVDNENTVDENGYAQEQVACGQVENIAALNELMLKSQNVNTEINQLLVEQAMKQNALMEAQREKERQEKEAFERDQMIQREVDRRRSLDYVKYIEYPKP